MVLNPRLSTLVFRVLSARAHAHQPSYWGTAGMISGWNLTCRDLSESAPAGRVQNEKDGTHQMEPLLPSASARIHTGGETLGRNEAHSSGVSWPAVIAGAVVAAALSLALLALGTGIGLSALSPWTNTGVSASRVDRTTIAWLILMQLVASSVGGYLAGRLRTRWVNIHTHEVFFRDTAHGFLVWATGLVITAAFLTSAASSLVGGAGRATMTAADRLESAQSSEGLGPAGYLVDRLLRTTPPGADKGSPSVRGEIGLIFANGLRKGSLSPSDRSYLAQVVTAKTGESEPDAERRVDDAFGEAQQSADSARRAIAHSMYWTFLALLIGAFSASVAATLGGTERDRVVVI
jgi:hypothetical protein